jgi:hypothetical protein
MNRDDALQFLVKKSGYSSEKAKQIWAKIKSSDPMIQEAFRSLAKGEDIDHVKVEGYTLSRLVEEYNMKPVAALLTLDWLIEEPEVASQALSRGYDTIIS